MNGYKLCALVEGNEIELLSSDLYQIDRITTFFEDESAFFECLFGIDYKNYADYNLKLAIKTPHDNKIETIFSSVRNVLYDSYDTESFQSFLNELLSNKDNNHLLFNSLNNLLNKRIIGLKENRTFSKEIIDDLDYKRIHLWDRHFESKVKDDKTLLAYKSKYDVLNKEIVLSHILNILEGNDDEKDLEHNLNTFLRGTSKNESKRNYRNYRDLYLQIASSYQTILGESKINKVIAENNTKEEQGYIYQVMSLFKKKVIKFINEIIVKPANITSQYQDVNKINNNYYEELQEKLKQAINKGDSDEIERLTEKLKSYESDSTKKIVLE